MPPHLPRKRLRTPSPAKDVTDATASGTAKKAKPTRGKSVPFRKATLSESLEAAAKERSAEKTQSALQQMHEDDSESSSLSSLSDAEFEDVPSAKRQKLGHNEDETANGDDDDDDDDDDMEFEDVPSHQPQADPVPSGDLELTLYQGNHVPLVSEMGKKGPSKKEKAIRITTHCMHVQFLLWHNAFRNSWMCDPEVHAILISHVPPRLWDEVDRWRRNSGLDVPDEVPRNASTSKGPSKSKGKGKGKSNQKASKPARDWSQAADRLERGAPDLSHGDPLIRLVKGLSSWWKQRFTITAPGLRKWGYMNVRRTAKLRDSHAKDDYNPEKYGERIRNVHEFRRHAQVCSGSRDVGSQLFTALLRALGLDARMVANIQPLGFGWSKVEEADDPVSTINGPVGGGTGSSTPRNVNANTKSVKKPATKPRSRRSRNSDADALKIDIDDSDEYAEPVSQESEDDDSVQDVTEAFRPRPPKAKPYDKDLDFPHYWTEVVSPILRTWLPVDPIVKGVVASSREMVESLEPRGGKADKAKQVMAYCVAFSSDGTAKDVTVRYLKKQIAPGKTKGFRMPVEKIPVYNQNGKVKRHEMFDWTKAVMRGYARGSKDLPITEDDEIEDSTDLKPAQPEKKEVKEGEETLQYYKSSKEYVLARHLKREEALPLDAVPVKTFRNKGKGSKVEEEDVFLRKDVLPVKSAETWHKQGRAPVDGAIPLKHAPYRAATTNRRRELAEAEAAAGHKVLQPLYSIDQTSWIIPPPIENGVIPKNEYGNIDMFAEHMCPEGAVHVPYRGGVKVCKRLEIDFAEAVVGFEFGHRMAVPVIQGVVIAEEHYERMVEELEKDEAERVRKEDAKRQKAALGMWRKFLMGLRIAGRIMQDYGHMDASVEVFGHARDQHESTDANFDDMRHKDEDMAGGFLPEGYNEEEMEEPKPVEKQTTHKSAFFPEPEDDDGDDDLLEVEYGYGHQRRQDGESVVESEADAVDAAEEDVTTPAKAAPKGLKKAAAKPKAKPKKRQSPRRRTRRKVESSEEDEDDEEFEITDSE